MDNSKWYSKTGPDGDVVLSSRVRLARNLRDYPFPAKSGLKDKIKVREIIKKSILDSNSYIASEFNYIELENLTQTQAVSMVERHLVSPDFIADMKDKALLINKDESVSIMINEEDHIRIQVLKEGMSLTEAFEYADRIDTLINENVAIAFDNRLGYLTQCPTNLGTGMRASVMLHLPALTESGTISRITSNLSKIGIIIRGTYGEGTKIKGNIYQISNQITLGLSEQEALANLQSVTAQIVAQERRMRKELILNLMVQDKISRAIGVLKSAKLLSSDEFMDLISLVRFGVSANLISGLSFDAINKLMIEVQPATMGEFESTDARDMKRAEIVKEKLLDIVF